MLSLAGPGVAEPPVNTCGLSQVKEDLLQQWIREDTGIFSNL